MQRIRFKLFILLTLCLFSVSSSCAAQPLTEQISSKTPTTLAKQYICIGDSITNGHGNTSFEAYPHQLALLVGAANSYKEFGSPSYPERPLPEGWLIQNPANQTIVINHGIESQSIQLMLANVEAQVGNRLGNANETVVLLLGGINDIGQGRSAAAIQADWAAYGVWCRNHNVKLYIGTMTAISSLSSNAVRMEANAWLRNNWQNFADKLIDFAGNEALADATNLLYFNADGIHPNGGGDLRMARIANSVINGSYQAPTITRTSVSTGFFRIVYNQTLTVSGGDGAITWRLRSGVLPSGESFNAATHKFEGVPTVMGTYPNIVIRATDATGDFHERIFSIFITRKYSLCSRGFIRNCAAEN